MSHLQPGWSKVPSKPQRSTWKALLFIALSTTADMALSDTIKICDDIGEWPPFTYFARENGEMTTEVLGYTVNLIDKIFKDAGLEYSIDLLPWKRCLASVESGSHHMLLNATYNEKRAETFLFSDAHSTITPSVFFLKSTFPEGLKIKSKSELKKYRIGGIHGYNYDYYGLDESDIISKGIYNYEALIAQLKREHVSVFVENYEILTGFKLVGKKYLEQSIGSAPIEDMPPTPVYMLFNKGKTGERLKSIIDKQLPILSGSEYLTKYMSEISE